MDDKDIWLAEVEVKAAVEIAGVEEDMGPCLDEIESGREGCVPRGGGSEKPGSCRSWGGVGSGFEEDDECVCVLGTLPLLRPLLFFLTCA